MRLAALVLVLVAAVLATQTVLFEDDFNDGNADGWFIIMPEGTYFVNDSLRYEIAYYGTDDIDPCVVRGDSLGMYMTTEHYSVLLEGIGHSPSDYIGVFIRGTLSQTGYVMWLRYGYNDVAIFRHEGVGSWNELTWSNYSLTYDDPYWIRFECCQDTLRGKVWEGTVGDEPAYWLVTAVDNNYCNCGFMGFVTGRYAASGDSRAELDNVVVTSVEPVYLEASSWARIKSISL
jgi:hypothetical protein